MKEKGVQEHYLNVKLCGGASMRCENDLMSIGRKNVSFVKDILHKEIITITGQELGGVEVRTLICNLNNGKINVQTKGQNSKREL